jgi:hypothetical protein
MNSTLDRTNPLHSYPNGESDVEYFMSIDGLNN